jgi:peptide/nickel transport system substrate-binding protein
MNPDDKLNTEMPTETPVEAPDTKNSVSGTPADQPADKTFDQPVTASVVDNPPKGGGKGKKTLVALLVLIIFGGLIYAAMQLGQPAKKTGTTNTTTKADIPVLNVGVVNGAVALYPNDNATDSYAQAVNAQIYEGLVQYRDQSKIVPLLATSWTNPDASTWDFNLKHNVSFHNGHKLTAADVAYSLKLARDSKAFSESYADTIKDAKALNDNKVEITTTKPDPFFLNKLTFLMILDSKSPTATDTSNGTGPFQLKPGSKPTETGINLVAFDSYHGGHVSVRALNFIGESDEDTASTDFKNHKINMLGEYNSANPKQLSGVNYQKYIVDDAGVTFMTVNSVANGPLQKLPVRQALRESLDSQTVIKNADITAAPAWQMVTKAIPGYNPDIAQPKQDVADAKSKLASAGYADGVKLQLEITPAGQAVANEVVKEAAAAGFTLTIKTADNFDSLVGDMIDGKTDLAILAFSSDVLDGSDVFTQVLQQTANYKSATLDNYLKQASETTDQAARLKILQKTSKLVYDDVAAIPILNRQRTWVTDKNYTIQFDTLSGVPGVYFWQAYTTK